MEQTTESSRETEITPEKEKQTTRNPRKRMQRTRSFTDALREKYCSSENDSQCDFIINIMFRHTPPKSPGKDTAELAHLRNVVLNNRRVSIGGLPPTGLSSLCPNVTDLDLSCNLLESWAELLPILSQLPNLTFLNLSRNHLTRHKEELWRWGVPLPRVENVVLNSTGIPLREVLALARLMPALRELHICCNYYRDLGSIKLAIQDGALSKLECLRLNENIITSWAEVWKLRHLPHLTQLILSENPMCDVFYDLSWHPADDLDVDSPNVTCHSDGEDSTNGSPRFRYPVHCHCNMKSEQHRGLDASHGKCHSVPNINTSRQGHSESCGDVKPHVYTATSTGDSTGICTHKGVDQLDKNAQCSHKSDSGAQHIGQGDSREHHSGRNQGLPDGNAGGDNTRLSSVPCEQEQSNFVFDLLNDLVFNALERIGVQESCQHCGAETQDVNRNATSMPRRQTPDDNAAYSSKALEEDFCDGLHGMDEHSANMSNASHNNLTSTPVKTLSKTPVNKPVSRAVRSLFTTCAQDAANESLDSSMTEFYLGEDQTSENQVETSMDMGIESELNNSNMMNDSNQLNTTGDGRTPFAVLHTLCLSRTSISDMDHLLALNDFPQLCSLKIMDTGLFPDVSNEDKRKLLVASLPHVKILNGSEVTVTERDKAERHYLRHFFNCDTKPARYYELENKHGPTTPLLDIDLGKKFQKEATMTFFLSGEEVFTDTVSVLQPVGKLRSLVAATLGIPRRSFRMFHYACGPDQAANDGEGAIDELCLESLPLSRFDFMDGDEIHVEFIEGPNASAVVHFSKKEIKF